MIETIEAFIKTEQWQDPMLIPHPYTWLNRGGWDDETIVEGIGDMPDSIIVGSTAEKIWKEQRGIA